VVLLAELVVFLVAIAGIICGALGALFFAGGAFNQARPRDFRIRRGVYAALCVCAIVASAALGFVGIGTIMYLAQQS
jgi:hypothetical protein